MKKVPYENNPHCFISDSSVATFLSFARNYVGFLEQIINGRVAVSSQPSFNINLAITSYSIEALSAFVT